VSAGRGDHAGDDVVRPRNPYIGFAFAAAWLAVAAFGSVVLVIDSEAVLSGDVRGQRSVGLFLVTPVIGAVVGISTAVRACLAISPWNTYLARTTAEQRLVLSDGSFSRRSFTPLVLAGAVVAVGWFVVLATAAIGFESATVVGRSAVGIVLVLLGMVGLTLISVGVRGNAANRRRQSR
jgi:hypothetical protein